MRQGHLFSNLVESRQVQDYWRQMVRPPIYAFSMNWIGNYHGHDLIGLGNFHEHVDLLVASQEEILVNDLTGRMDRDSAIVVWYNWTHVFSFPPRFLAREVIVLHSAIVCPSVAVGFDCVFGLRCYVLGMCLEHVALA